MSSRYHSGGTEMQTRYRDEEDVQRLTQFVRGGDDVSGDTRVQICVHDAEGIQLSHVVTSDLQVTTAEPARTGREEEEGGRWVSER